MMILSQDKMMCVPFEKGLTYINYSYPNKICWSETSSDVFTGVPLGTYNSEQDAKNVLQKICNEYEEVEGCSHLFYMPQANEI